MKSASEWRPGDNPGFYLNLASRLFMRFMDRELAHIGINVAYLPVIGALHDSPALSQKELTAVGKIGQPAMAQMLDRMVKEGLVLRQTDDVDRRKIRFMLSKKAEDLIPKIEQTLKKESNQLLSGIDEEHRDVFLNSLKKLSEILMNRIEQEEAG